MTLSLAVGFPVRGCWWLWPWAGLCPKSGWASSNTSVPRVQGTPHCPNSAGQARQCLCDTLCVTHFFPPAVPACAQLHPRRRSVPPSRVNGSIPQVLSPQRPPAPQGTGPAGREGWQPRAGGGSQPPAHVLSNPSAPLRARAGLAGDVPPSSPFVMKSQACVPESSPCGRSHPSPLEISILSLLLGCRGVWLQTLTEQFTSNYRSQKGWEDFSSGFLQPKPTYLNYNLGSISLVGE